MKKLSHLSTKLFLVVTLLFTSSISMAGGWNVNKKGVVLDGHDVVAYQTQDKAVKGSAKYSAKYDGATFYFSSQENADMFKKEPVKYAPKYNGFCAFGAANGKTDVPANPSTFKMYNGELLVFYNGPYEGKNFNTKLPWNANEKELYGKAESNWKGKDKK